MSGKTRPPRAFMKHLPPKLEDRTKVTSAKCPHVFPNGQVCGRTGARVSRTQPGKLYFPCCNLIADVPADV